MIFHKKIFQCVMAPIPLLQTPQKIGLLMGIARVCPCPKILPVKQHYSKTQNKFLFCSKMHVGL